MCSDLKLAIDVATGYKFRRQVAGAGSGRRRRWRNKLFFPQRRPSAGCAPLEERPIATIGSWLAAT